MTAFRRVGGRMDPPVDDHHCATGYFKVEVKLSDAIGLHEHSMGL